jgi:FixJ family two-component response regulator
MKKSDIKIFVVENDKPMRDSLGALFVSRHYAVQSFESGEEFLGQAPVDQAGVVVLDLRMEPGISGLEVFHALNAMQSPLHVIFHSAFGDIPDVVQAMEGGAISWVIKSDTTDELLSKVELAAKKTLNLASLLRDRSEALRKWSMLTLAEKRTAPICARGPTAKAIAIVLNRQGRRAISHRTVEGHIREILRKLSVATTNELLAYMIRHRLPPEAPLS